MQLQFGSEYKKYVSTQHNAGGGDPKSNRLLNMVRKCSTHEGDARMRAHASASHSNKENTPLPMPNLGSANIDKIMQYIEGGPQNEAAFKKAQKKARQKLRKEEERQQREEEERALRKAEEARMQREKELADQQRIQEELALQKQLKKAQQSSKKKGQQQQVNNAKSAKKKNKDQPVMADYGNVESNPESILFEQTIPAMVTIKRVVENNNAPALVTITLKGSTPDQDKLLYTLVNGHDAPSSSPTATPTVTPTNNKQQKQEQQASKKLTEKQKKKKNASVSSSGETKNSVQSVMNCKSNSSSSLNKTKNKEVNATPPSGSACVRQVQTSEIKVQLAVDSSFHKDVAKLKEQAMKQPQKSPQLQQKQKQQSSRDTVTTVGKSNKKQEVNTKNSLNSLPSSSNSSSSLSSTQEILDIPSIKLPPGITITKVSGPLTNRKPSTTPANDYPDVPVSRSGVIVVDTEKLIQQQEAGATSKKKKKKMKKAATVSATVAAGSNGTGVRAAAGNSEPRVLIQSSSESKVTASCSAGMVTLKNPIFHPIQGGIKHPSSEMSHMMNMDEQATISQGENGMVTIRRPRPVGFMTTGANESSISEYLAQNAVETSCTPAPSTSIVNHAAATSAPTGSSSPLAGYIHAKSQNPPILTPWQMPDTSFSTLNEDRKIIRPPSPRGVQWPRTDCENGKINTPSVLQGLHSIEITRVRTGSPIIEPEYVEAPANVSIIRTGGYNVRNNPQKWAYPAQP